MKSFHHRILFSFLRPSAIAIGARLSMATAVSVMMVAPFAVAAPAPTAAKSGGVVVDRLEASVNSAIILLSDVAKFRQTLGLRAQLDPLFSGTELAAKGNAASDTEIVRFLVDEKLIAGQFPVTDAEVEQEINSIQSNNKLDREGLRTLLKNQGFAFDDYFELIKSGAAKRNLIERDIRTKVAITDDDIKNYFYNHLSKAGAVPTAYQVRMIVVTGANYKTPAAAREVADRALKDIKGGEAFEEVAKRVSDDPTAATGGDLGTLSDDQMSPLFRDQLKKMKIGEVSGVVGDGQSRFLLLKLVDVKSSDTERLEKMKEEIRGQLAASEYQHQISLWLERQRQAAYIAMVPGHGDATP